MRSQSRQGGRKRGRTRKVAFVEYAASVAEGTATRLASRAQRRQGRRGQGGPQAFWGQQDGQRGRAWALAVQHRPQFAFGKGDTSQLFNFLPELRVDSSAAPVALMHYLTMQQAPADPTQLYTQERAGNELTQLLCEVFPTPQAMASAKARRREAQQHGNPLGIATAELKYLEVVYLCFVQGIQPGQSIQQLSSGLYQVAEGLKQATSDRRQAIARIILADVLTQQRQPEQAKQQMVQALAIIGTIGVNKELQAISSGLDHKVLAQIARDADPAVAEQAISAVNSSATTTPSRAGARSS